MPKDKNSQHGMENIQVKQAFPGRWYERPEFSMEAHGEEYKGYVSEGDVQWFNPQPEDNEHVQAVEAEIQQLVAGQEGATDTDNNHLS